MGVRIEQLDVPESGALERTWLLTVGGVPLDLTGWTAKMQIRSRKASDTVLGDFSTGPGGYMTIVGAAGAILLDVPSSVTESFTFTNGVWDMYVIDPTGNRKRVVEGNVVVSATVTR